MGTWRRVAERDVIMWETREARSELNSSAPTERWRSVDTLKNVKMGSTWGKDFGRQGAGMKEFGYFLVTQNEGLYMQKKGGF